MSLQDRIAELQKNSLSWKERVEKVGKIIRNQDF